MTKSVAVIFVNTYGRNKTEDVKYFQKAETARDLFQSQLNFQEVHVYVNLVKSQVIEKLNMLQLKADHFESKKKAKQIFAIAIVSIGRAFSPETIETHRIRAELNRMTKPGKAIDGSAYFAHYMLTTSKKPVNFIEYGGLLATGSSTYVIQLIDCESLSDADYLDQKSEFNELILQERPGRARHSCFTRQGCIDKIHNYISNSREEPNRDAF